MRTLAAALLCTASLASAQAPAPAPTKNADATTMHADDCARARALHKTCVLDIKGDDIDGHSPTAGGSVINAREWIGAASLIHLRRDFITEIIKTAEDL
ncbi:MAG TPA: hypothetical protein VFQ65_07235 [Kofleriaceae bacterium]|nr:hypothetical protein [Kofleriaceae bacterium]